MIHVHVFRQFYLKNVDFGVLEGLLHNVEDHLHVFIAFNINFYTRINVLNPCPPGFM